MAHDLIVTLPSVLVGLAMLINALRKQG